MTRCSLFLLSFSTFSALLFLASGTSDVRSLHQLQNRAFLLFLVLQLHGSPHLVDFSLASALRLFLHVELLSARLHLKVVLRELLIFISHHLTLAPL